MAYAIQTKPTGHAVLFSLENGANRIIKTFLSEYEARNYLNNTDVETGIPKNPSLLTRINTFLGRYI